MDLCYLCGEKPATDRDHIPDAWRLKDGKLRGRLCHQCNVALGMVERVGIDKIRAYLGACPIGPTYCEYWNAHSEARIGVEREWYNGRLISTKRAAYYRSLRSD